MSTAWSLVPVPVSPSSCQTTRTGHHGTLTEPWDWASVVFPEPTAQMATTLEQTAAATGLREGLVARLFDAWELPRPQPGQALRADDQELLHLAVPVLEGGVA
jgi:hypothetical protein